MIGAIDGSLIAIKGPDSEEHLYVCYKGFHAINVMAVCNAQMLFTNVVSKWHGSVHDSVVFHSSTLQVHVENEGGRNGWLLGDKGLWHSAIPDDPISLRWCLHSGSGQIPEGPYQNKKHHREGPWLMEDKV